MTDTPAEREDSSIWAKLRRRRVAQWALAYAAGAWVLLQVLGFAADAFGWPNILKPLAMLGLVLGLPVVLTLAWYHGERAQQRVTGQELAILTLLLLIGGGLLWWYANRRAGAPPAVASTTTAPPASATIDPRPSIAVLPFDNRSDEKKDAYFVDGIHDDILTQLSKISALRVISRTSVERFRKTELSVQQIAQQLGVKSILEGGVQRAGGRVRINVQLIDAATDAHSWAESYDRELTVANMFAIQSEVAAAIAGALKTALTPAEQARATLVPTQNLEAWEAYQLGKQRMATRTSAGLANTEQLFRKAIDLDPKFALAYVGLADTAMMQAEYSGTPWEGALRNADQAVAKALESDPDLAEAWTSSGNIARNRREYDRAESMFRRAIELNPNYATARQWYGGMLRELGRLDDALVQLQRAVELDPLSTVIKQNLGGALEAQGRFPEAGAAYRKAITIDPSRPGSYRDLAMLYAYALDRFTHAIPLAQKAVTLDPGSPRPSGVLAGLYSDLGDDTQFVQLATQAAKSWPDDPDIEGLCALVDLFRRDAAGAVRHAQRAYDLFPQSAGLMVLRNADLQNGRYDAALARYEKAFPELFVQIAPRIDGSNYWAAIDLALVAQKRGDSERAGALLNGATRAIRSISRLGQGGYWISDVQIHALRGDKAKALTALREAEKAGWRGPLWRFFRDFDPNLASIRNEPGFKAVFADIERDMAEQRARLAARPKDAPLELSANTH